jgi:hypothetical protein
MNLIVPADVRQRNDTMNRGVIAATTGATPSTAATSGGHIYEHYSKVGSK